MLLMDLFIVRRLCVRVMETRIIIRLTLLYGLCDFRCVLGEVQVCHVGL